MEWAVPPTEGLNLGIEVQDQGLDIKLVRSTLGLWTVRVNPGGGDDVVFGPLAIDVGRPTLHFRLVWKAGATMNLWLNHQLRASKPFTPPRLA